MASPSRNTRTFYSANVSQSICFFCYQVEQEKNLRKASTLTLDRNILSVVEQLSF